MQMNHAVVGQRIPNVNSAVKLGKRTYLFNHFDGRLDDLVVIVKQLLLNKGVFYIAVYFSSSQLVCWALDNPYSFRMHAAEEVFADEFLSLFSPMTTKIHSCINKNRVMSILEFLKGLRENAGGSELRNASIHMLNAHVGLTFTCDDTRFINYKNFVLPSALNFTI
jgi:hypothetical protein